MKIIHFSQVDLLELPSCFLDPKGNIIILSASREVGVHEELACEILDTVYGEDYQLDHYHEIRDCGMYTYQYLEEKLGYFRYSHWIGSHGVFNGEMDKMTFAQKQAIRQFCKVNGVSWNKILGI